MSGASKHDHNDARGVAASEEAATPSEAEAQAPLTQVAVESADADSLAAEEQLDNHDHPVELDLEELIARAEKADEYLDLAQRTQADFENYRKRTARDAANAQTRGISKLARELLPAIDNLERAMAAADSTTAGELASGIKLVHDEVLAALGRAGIEPFSPAGEQFDPQHHEAVAQIPSPECEPGTVLEVYQRGYRLGDAVLRPARVSVAG
jgi:molecular chaperone GrpE